MSALRSAIMVVVSFWLLMLRACKPDPNTAQGTAEGFLDAHYVGIDLSAAKAYCTGFARSRVEEEIRLTADQVIDASVRQPRVYYQLVEETPRGEASVAFLYTADFEVDGAGRFTKKILLTLRHQEDGWRVVNFSEYD